MKLFSSGWGDLENGAKFHAPYTIVKYIYCQSSNGELTYHAYLGANDYLKISKEVYESLLTYLQEKKES